MNKVKTLARPYVTKICGIPSKADFTKIDSEAYFLQLDWKASNDCNGKNTEVFLS